METIDPSILDKGYSIFKSIATGQYFAMSDNEIKRIRKISGGKIYQDLRDDIKVSVVELIVQSGQIVLLNEDKINVTANQLTPVPVKIS